MNRREAIQCGVSAAVLSAMRPALARMGRGGVALTKRPLGLQSTTNALSYFGPAPFLNLVKSGGWSNTGTGSYRSCPWNTLNGSGETNEEQFVQLDSNGYPTSLVAADIGNGAPGTQAFTFLQMYLRFNMAALAPGQTNFYPPGVYRLRFIGQGTVKVVGDGTLTLTNAASNTYVSGTFTVTTPTQNPGLKLQITAVSSGTDNPRDISVVEDQYAALFDAGQVYHPNWLAIYAGFSCVRGMQWTMQDNMYFGVNISAGIAIGATSATMPRVWPYKSQTLTTWFYGGQSFPVTFTYNSATIQWSTPLATAISTDGTSNVIVSLGQGDWSLRTPVTYVSWAMGNTGVPDEIIIAQANEMGGADVHLNAPIDASDSYFTSQATLINTTLNAGRRGRGELSNEVWNTPTYQQGHMAQMMGCAQWPAQANDSNQMFNWYGMRCAVMSELWALVASVPSRLVPMVGMQGGTSSTLTKAMETTYWTAPISGYTGPAKAHKISAVVANYYFPNFYGGPHAAGPSKLLTVADATTMVGVATPLDDFFACMHGNVGTVANGSHVYSSLSYVGFGGLTYSGWIDNEYSDALTNLAAANSYGLPLSAYEAGGNFFANDAVLNGGGATVPGWAALVTAAMRDPRMRQASLDHLNWWHDNIGTGSDNICVVFADAFPATATNGCWGITETSMQTLNATNTPRWQGCEDYIAGL